MMSRKARLMTMMMQGQGSQKYQTTQQTPCKWIQRLCNTLLDNQVLEKCNGTKSNLRSD